MPYKNKRMLIFSMVRYMGERRRGKNLESKKAVSLILSALILTTSITMPSLTVKATTVKGNEQIISSKIAEEAQPTTNDGQTNPPTGEETGTPIGGEEQGGNTGNNGEVTPPAEEPLKVVISNISSDVRIDGNHYKVDVRVTTENNSTENGEANYLNEFSISYKDPKGQYWRVASLLKTDEDDNVFEGYVEGDGFESGVYTVDTLALHYRKGERVDLSLESNPEIKSGNFTIEADRVEPYATNFYITNNVVRSGEKFRIVLNAKDNRKLNGVAVIFQIPGTEEVTAVEVPYYNYGDQFEVELYFDEELPYGTWKVVAIYLIDGEGNAKYYLNTDDKVDPILKGAEIQHVKAINSGWNNFNGSWYYYQPKGLVQHRGWLSYNGNWYYLNKNGVMETGWITDNGRKYFMKASGAMATGWVSSGGKWYYMSGNGSITTGWVYNNNKWYYLGADGAMYTGWTLYKGSWYYLEYSGAMKTGWVNSGGTWYYLGNSGKMITGWVQAGGKWYYMYENGAMAVNTVVQGYKIGASGAWIK